MTFPLFVFLHHLCPAEDLEGEIEDVELSEGTAAAVTGKGASEPLSAAEEAERRRRYQAAAAAEEEEGGDAVVLHTKRRRAAGEPCSALACRDLAGSCFFIAGEGRLQACIQGRRALRGLRPA